MQRAGRTPTPRTPFQIPFRDFGPTNKAQWTHIVDRTAASPASPSLKRSETSLRQLMYSYYPNGTYPF